MRRYEEDEAQAIRRAQGGDEDAFVEIMHRYRALILRISRRVRFAQSDIVDDVEQVAWIGLWNAVMTYDPTRGSFKNWVRRVVRCAVLDLYQHLHRRVRYPGCLLVSLDEPVGREDEYGWKDRSLRHEVVPEELAGALFHRAVVGMEDRILARMELHTMLQELRAKLTRQEHKVLAAMLRYHAVAAQCLLPAGPKSDVGAYGEVARSTGLSLKQVDNTWQRVRRKAKALAASAS